MRFKQQMRAPDIEIEPLGDGQTIAIVHTFMTAFQRATAVELLARGIAASMAYFYEFVIGWEGVEDESGAPLPLKRKENNEEVNVLDRIIGQLPFATQVEIWYQWLTINGVDSAALKGAAKEFLDPAAYNRLMERTAQLGKLRGITPGNSPSA